MTEARRYGMRSLRFKLVLASVVVEIIMLTVLVWNSTRITGDAIREIFQNRVDTLVPLMNVSLANSLVQRDYVTLDERLKRIVRQDSLTYIEVRDELGAVAASRGEVPKTARLDVSFKATDQVYDQTFDITLTGRVIGRAHYGLNVSLPQATLTNLRNQGALVASAEIILTILLLATMGALLTRHLRAMAQAARALTGGDYAVRIPVAGRDEVADTAQAFNTMADTLARDLAKRQRAEAARRASEQTLQRTLDAAHIGHWNLDLSTHTASRSLRHDQIFGYAEPLADWSYEKFLTHVHPEDSERVDRLFQAGMAAKTQWDFECRITRHDGVLRWIWAHGNVFTSAAGEPERMLGMVSDITERKQAEEEIRQLNLNLERRVLERTTELQAANQELEAFSYSVSHDLRAPLRSIDGFSLALLEDYADKLDGQGKDYLTRVRTATQRMGHLIDDMLNLSRVSRAEMRRGTVDLSALAAEVFAELQKSEPLRRVDWHIESGLIAEGDAQLLRVVLVNLLGNAWKFTGKTANAKIEFGAASDLNTGNAPIPNTQAAPDTQGVPDFAPGFFVRDNGVGYDMSYADKLFGAFQRQHRVGDFPGTGIGLATVQRIIHRHGGRVWAEGAVGKGATFYFAL